MKRTIAFMGIFAAAVMGVAVALRAMSGGQIDAVALGAAAMVLVPVVRYLTSGMSGEAAVLAEASMTRTLAVIGLFSAGVIIAEVLLRALSGGRFDAFALGAAAFLLVLFVRTLTGKQSGE
jgi:hypothetical protein